MRVIINKKSNIGEILSAVYYKSPAMPIGVPSLYSSLDSGTQALLRSSSSLAPGVAQEIRYNAGELGVDYRFFEYGLTSFPSPEGVLPNMSRDMASVLFYDNSIPNKPMWLGMGEFNGFSKYIIPTNAPGSSLSGLKFFGSFRTTTQEIYTFPAGPGISKIELYDINIDPSLMSRIYDHDLGYGDFQNYEPVISIYLGCSKNGNTPRWSNNIYNKDSRYFIGTQENSVDRVMDHDYKLYSERFDSKVVFLAIGQREEDKLQISYNAWLKLYDPLRNKPEYDVIEREKTNDPEQLGGVIENSYFDLASGSYLGNFSEIPTPILDDKLKKLGNNQRYSSWKRYRAGDVAVYGGRSWTSLCSDNCGNVPGFSSKWVLSSRMNDFYTSWFLVRCQEAQEIRPGFKINVPDYQKESMFKLYPKPGYIPTEAVIGRLNADGDIDRAVMTENIDIDELRYYIFYLKWNQEKKNLGALRGKVIDLGKLEKKPLYPTIRIPDILIQNEGGKNVCTWNTKLTEYKIGVEGKKIVIDSELEVSIFDQVIAQVTGGTGINKSQANQAFMSLVEKMKFSLEYIKSIPGKTWETGESEVEPWVTIGRTNIDTDQDALTNIILHEKNVDYEDCAYILIPGWDYKKITVSNSGDFDIEYPVFDVVRTENFRSGVLSRNGAVPSEIMIKYPLESGEWSSWQHREFVNGKADWMLPGLGGNKVHLDRTPGNPNLYTLQVENVTVNLIIDIKV